MKLLSCKASLVGMSRGWGLFKVDLETQRNLYLSDYFNPCSSKSNPKIIPLYALVAQDDGVSIKYLGKGLNFSRPSGKHNVHLVKCSTLFHHFDQSKVMYSKKEQRFYIPNVGGHLLSSWDSCVEENCSYKLHELQYCNLPDLNQSEWELLDSCSKTVQLVESPSGQRFLIKWYVIIYLLLPEL